RALSTPLIILFLCTHTATTEIYPLSLHDALPIWRRCACPIEGAVVSRTIRPTTASSRTRGTKSMVRIPKRFHSSGTRGSVGTVRSEEHTSELQSRENLVCRLLLEKKKKKKTHTW